jgi:hypothetical protein
MGLRELLQRAFGGGTSIVDRPGVGDAIERIVQIANPKLKLVSRYRARLAPPVAASLQYVEQLVAPIPAARVASAQAWAGDPCLAAFFATAPDIARAFSRSRDVRAYFDANPGATETFALLGMEMTERRVLGMDLQGDVVRSDVPQTTLSFGDHRMRLCAGSEADLRVELQRRLVEQLAMEGVKRAGGDQSQREDLGRDRALLQARLKLPQRRGGGIQGALGDEVAGESERGKITAELEQNAEALAALGGTALEREFNRVREILSQPAQALHVASRRVRLDRMNVIQKAGSKAGAELEFQVAHTEGPPPRSRAFALVKFLRADLLPPGQGIADAERLLG